MNPYYHYYPYPYHYPFIDYQIPPPFPNVKKQVQVKKQPQPEPQIQKLAQPRKHIQTRQKNKMHKKHDKSRARGHWSVEENKNYHLFLQTHSNPFVLKQLRRMDKIFRTMSSFIGTRIPEQCRSHHQKQQKKYGTYFNIIRNLRVKYYSSDDHIPIKNALEAKQLYGSEQILSSAVLKTKQGCQCELFKKKSLRQAQQLKNSEQDKMDDNQIKFVCKEQEII